MTKSNNNTNTYEALPLEVRTSALTPKQKAVLDVLYMFSTLDKTMENGGRFYITNKQLAKEAGGLSEHTVITACSLFIKLNFIQRIAGNYYDKKATTYLLNEDIIMQWSIDHQQEATAKRATAKSTNCSRQIAVDEAIKIAVAPLVSKIEEMKQEISNLRQEIAELKATAKSEATAKRATAIFDSSVQNCTTEIEKEIEKEKYIDLIPNNPLISSNTRTTSEYIRQEATAKSEATEIAVDEIAVDTPASIQQEDDGEIFSKSQNHTEDGSDLNTETITIQPSSFEKTVEDFMNVPYYQTLGDEQEDKPLYDNNEFIDFLSSMSRTYSDQGVDEVIDYLREHTVTNWQVLSSFDCYLGSVGIKDVEDSRRLAMFHKLDIKDPVAFEALARTRAEGDKLFTAA